MRRPDKEVANSFGLALQHLLGEVVDDVTVVAREVGDEAGDIIAPLHRQSGQLEGGNPALSSLFQRRHLRRAQMEAHDVVEVSGGLVSREPQVGRSDLQQVAART